MNKINLLVLTKLQIFRQYRVSSPQYIIDFEQWKWSQEVDGYFWNIFESLSVYILKKMLSFLFPFISGIATLNNILKHPGNAEFVHKLFLNPHLCALFFCELNVFYLSLTIFSYISFAEFIHQNTILSVSVFENDFLLNIYFC